MRYLLAALAFLLLSFSASAQKLIECFGQMTCPPPAAFRLPNAVPPLDAPVRFGGEFRKSGTVLWLWIKAGEASKPCTPSQAAERMSYGKACAAKVGDPLYATMRFIIDQ